MRLLQLTLPTLPEDLALDEALLLEAEAGRGGEILRLWERPTPGIVLGAAGILAEDVDEEACRRDGIPLARRGSGGGTVLLGPGCLCFSLVLAYERAVPLAELTPSYEYILTRLARALGDLAPDIAPAGTSDLANLGKKFSGNSQQRKRNHLLHHGTILYDFDLSLLGRYLRQPSRQPEYRAGRTHLDFVMNLPARREQIVERLRTAWGAEGESTTWPAVPMRELLERKYARAEWIRRR